MDPSAGSEWSNNTICGRAGGSTGCAALLTGLAV